MTVVVVQRPLSWNPLALKAAPDPSILTSTKKFVNCVMNLAHCSFLTRLSQVFRLGLGGAQGYFDVTPDLTVFGKCVAGGYPAAGGLGGRADVMATLAAGLESGKERAYVGGTLVC